MPESFEIGELIGLEEGGEVIDEADGSDGSHSPFQSPKHKHFHPMDRLAVEDEPFVSLFHPKIGVGQRDDHKQTLL